MSESLLHISGLNAWYGKQKVLHNIEMSIGEGEIVGVFGHNGAGKTSILNSILGYAVKASGSIRFDGREIVGMTPHEMAAMGIGVAPQGLGIFGSLKVYENVEFGNGESKTIRREQARKIGGELSVIDEKWNQFGHQLSGGQRQLVSIGRELAKQPRLLLLDEPSVGLAPKMVSETLGLLTALRGRGGVSALLVEQNIPSAAKVIDRGYVIRQGEVVFSGSGNDFKDSHSLIRYF